MNHIKMEFKRLLNTGFFHIFGSNVINQILIFLSGIIIVRFISKSDYGVYSYSLNILSFFTIALGMGMNSGVLQLCSENIKKPVIRDSIYNYGARVGILFNLAISAAIILIALIIKLPVNGANQILLSLSLIPFLDGIREMQYVYFRSTLDNKNYAYANTLSTVLIVTLSVLGSIVFQVEGLIIGKYIASTVTVALVFCSLKCKLPKLHSRLDKEIKKVLYKISIISMCNNGISNLLYLMDIFLIGLIIKTPDIIADYKVATVIPTALQFIPSAICVYIFPMFSMHKDENLWIRNKSQKVFLYMFAMNFIITAILIIFAPLIISIIFGSQYLNAVAPFRVLSLSYFFVGTFRVLSGNLLVTQRKLVFNLIMTIAAGTVNIIGNIILINEFGSLGAAYTTLFVTSISGIISTVYYFRIIRHIENDK